MAGFHARGCNDARGWREFRWKEEETDSDWLERLEQRHFSLREILSYEATFLFLASISSRQVKTTSQPYNAQFW